MSSAKEEGGREPEKEGFKSSPQRVNSKESGFVRSLK